MNGRTKLAIMALGVAGSIASIVALVPMFGPDEPSPAGDRRDQKTQIHYGNGDNISAERDVIVNKGVPANVVASWTEELRAQGVQQAQQHVMLEQLGQDFFALGQDLEQRSARDAELRQVLDDMTRGDFSLVPTLQRGNAVLTAPAVRALGVVADLNLGPPIPPPRDAERRDMLPRWSVGARGKTATRLPGRRPTTTAPRHSGRP